MRVTAIHRFRQESWMAPYIQVNTELRAKAKFDNSKLLMYDFWYNHIKDEYGNKANLH